MPFSRRGGWCWELGGKTKPREPLSKRGRIGVARLLPRLPRKSMIQLQRIRAAVPIQEQADRLVVLRSVRTRQQQVLSCLDGVAHSLQNLAETFEQCWVVSASL